MPLALRLGFPPRTLPTAVHFRVICYGVRWGALFGSFLLPVLPPGSCTGLVGVPLPPGAQCAERKP